MRKQAYLVLKRADPILTCGELNIHIIYFEKNTRNFVLHINNSKYE